MIIKENENRVRISLSKEKAKTYRDLNSLVKSVEIYKGDRGESGRGIKSLRQPTIDLLQITLTDDLKYDFKLPKGEDGKSITGKTGAKGEAGKDGRGIVSITQPEEDIAQVNYTDGTHDTLELPRGRDGREVELRATETHVQWRYVGEKNWKNLYLIPKDGTAIGGMGAGSLRVVQTINGLYGKVTLSAGANVVLTQVGNDIEISSSGSGGGGIWGTITGTLSNQTDLQNALNLKANISSLATVAFSGDHGDLIGLGDDDHPQYHNDARALTWLGTRSTTDLQEGSNLYFTDERVDDRVAALIQNGTGINWTYNDVLNTLTGNLTVTQYTDEMAQDAVGAMVDGTLVYVDATPLLTRAALTGDLNAPQGSNVTTLATVNGNIGSFGSATQVGAFTVNAKGLITAAANVSIAIPSSGVTDFVEAAQDAVGAMIDTSLFYTDGGPLLGLNMMNPNTWLVQQTFETVGTPAIQFGDVSGGNYANLAQGLVGDEVGLLGSGNEFIAVYDQAAQRFVYADGKIVVDNTDIFFPDFTTDGFVKFAHGTGQIEVDTNSYQLLDPALTSIAGVSWIQGDILFWSGVDTAARLAKDTNATRYLSNQGTSNNPSWSQINLANGVTGDLPFANVAQLTANSIAANATTGTADIAALSIAASRLVGRDATGNVAALTVGGGVEFTTGGIQTSAFTGDATKTAGGTALTLATVNGNIGTFGSATQVGTFTVNAKGLITAASNTSIQIAESQVTNLVTDLAGKQPLDSTLTALAAFNTNGFMTQTAPDTFTGRTITGTASRLDVTNGNGVSGNPTLDISSSYVGQASITTLGTITTGVWSGTTIAVNKGGSGATTLTGLLQGNGTSAFTAITDSSTVGQILRVTGTSTYAWGALDLADTDAVTGTLPIASVAAGFVKVDGSTPLTGAWAANNNITGLTLLTVDNLSIDLNTIASTNTNGNILLFPNGTGNVRMGITGNLCQVTSAGIMTFTGTGEYQIGTNKRAFTASLAPLVGVGFYNSPQRYTFTDTAGTEIMIVPMQSAMRPTYGFSQPSTSPAQITANINDYTAGTELGVWRIDTDAARNITGIQAPINHPGKHLTIWYVGANSAIFKQDDAASAAANRILNATGADITLTAGQGIKMWYDDVTLKWRAFKLA